MSSAAPARDSEFRRSQTHAKSCRLVPADKIETLAQWISEAERPVILAGGGVIASGARTGTARAGGQAIAFR